MIQQIHVRKRQFIKTINGNITHPLLREILHRWGGTRQTPLICHIHRAYLQPFKKYVVYNLEGVVWLRPRPCWG